MSVILITGICCEISNDLAGELVPIPTLSALTSTNNVFESKFTSPANVTAPVMVAALIVGAVKVLFVKVCEAVNNVIALVFYKSVEAIVMFPVPSND